MAKKKKEQNKSKVFFKKIAEKQSKLAESCGYSQKIILMCDMVGSSLLSEKMAVVIDTLRELYNEGDKERGEVDFMFGCQVFSHNEIWLRHIHNNGGEVFQILGEGICACFPIDDDENSQAWQKNIISAYKAVHDALEEIAEKGLATRSALHIGNIVEFPRDEGCAKELLLKLFPEVKLNEDAQKRWIELYSRDYFGRELAYCSRQLACALPNTVVSSHQIYNLIGNYKKVFNEPILPKVTCWWDNHFKSKPITFNGFEDQPYAEKPLYLFGTPGVDEKIIEEDFEINLHGKASEYVLFYEKKKFKQKYLAREKLKAQALRLKGIHDGIGGVIKYGSCGLMGDDLVFQGHWGERLIVINADQGGVSSRVRAYNGMFKYLGDFLKLLNVKDLQSLGFDVDRGIIDSLLKIINPDIPCKAKRVEFEEFISMEKSPKEKAKRVESFLTISTGEIDLHGIEGFREYFYTVMRNIMADGMTHLRNLDEEIKTRVKNM